MPPPDATATTETVVDPNAPAEEPKSEAPAEAEAPKTPDAPAVPEVDVSSLVTDLERTRRGMKGLRSQYEESRKKAEAFEKSIASIKAGGDPEAVLAAAEAAGIDPKAIENYLGALSARKETPEKRAQRELDKRLRAIEERDKALREREEAQETERAVGELSKSLAEEIKANAEKFPMLAKMADDAAKDLVERAAMWRAEQIGSGEDPSWEEFSAKVEQLALEDETEYHAGVIEALGMLTQEAAHQNKPLVEALAKIGFVPGKNEPAGKSDEPAAASAMARDLTDRVAAERGGEQTPDRFGPQLGRARAREAEVHRRSG